MRPYVLCFAHDDVRRFAGGVAKYIREEAFLAARRGTGTATVFPLSVVRPPRLKEWALHGWGVRRDGCWEGMFRRRGLEALLGRWEREGQALAEIQLHHVGRYDTGELGRFLAAVPAGVRLFLHDYHTVCPSTHLLRNGTAFCGKGVPCEAKCRGCRHWDPRWLPRMKALLGGIGDRLRVTAPSESVAEGWLETWPEFRRRVEVVPHWIPARTVRGPEHPPGRPLRLAFAGAQLPHKGWEVWCRTVEALRKAGSGYEFLYFGLGRELPEGIRAVGTGDGGMADALRRERVDFLCLWSVCPETYSYLYFEAVQAGAWVLAPEGSGNIADAIRKSGWGTAFPDEGSLLAFLRDETRARATLEHALTVERPAEMAVNPRVLDELPAAVPLGRPGEHPRRAWAHEAVLKLKEWTGHV